MSQDADLLGQVHVAVIRLDTKMDNITTELARVRTDMGDRHRDHEQRIRKLEGDHVTVEQFTELRNRPHISPASVRWLVGTVIAFAGLVIAIMNIVK